MLVSVAIFTIAGVFIVLAPQKSESVEKTQQVVVPEQALPTVPAGIRPVVVEQNDGSVIIHDKGASFKVAPLSNRQPAVVPEEMVRAAQKP